jgi:hypothetical protein
LRRNREFPSDNRQIVFGHRDEERLSADSDARSLFCCGHGIDDAMARRVRKSSQHARQLAVGKFGLCYLALLTSQLGPGLKPPRQLRGERLARALAIRHCALKLIDAKGRWGPLRGGPEVKQFEDDRFLVMFYVRPPVPVELRRRFGLGPLHAGLYSLELWDKPIGKVLNLSWNSVGALPQIVSFRPGPWEQEFQRSAS